jgi:threonine dehydratase
VAYEDQGLAPADLREARRRVGKAARVTPLIPSEGLSERAGRPVSLKCENLQVGGAFKIRGASHFLSHVCETGAPRGVVTYSSGNHGLAVALAARRAGVPAVVVMPETAPRVKLDRVRALGAEMHLAGSTSPERKTRAEALAAERGLTMVPPFDHPWIVAGQATCGVEILEQMPEVATVLVPVGGGGLVAGVTLACGYHRAGIRVVGVEPEGAAKMSASIRAGAPVTLPAARSIADGLLPLRPGDLTFSIVQRFGAQVVTVSDEAIREAARWLLETEHLLVEWSGAAPVAALLAGPPSIPDGPAVAVLSGGNADPRAILAPAPEA